MTRWMVLGAVALGGCGGKELDPQSGTVLEGFRFGWAYFNHRLSHLQVQAGSDATQIAIIGGTSTTNQVLDPLPETCDPESCDEFPFTDDAEVEVGWANLSSTRTAIAAGTVQLEVGADGATGTISARIPEGAPEVATALLSGLALSTDHPLSGGEACYRPEYGWHPRQIRISVGQATIDGDTVSAPVEAAFAAGKTFDPSRQCIDEVYDQAVVDLAVDVTFLVGDGQVAELDLVQGASFPFSGNPSQPEEQVDPSPIALDPGFEPTAVGFGTVDFRFDPERTDDRGAYIRTLSFTAVPKAAPEPIVEANATATNYSPGTQLEDFGYRFEGVVRAVDFELDVQRGTSTGSFTATLDAAGEPVVNTLEH